MQSGEAMQLSELMNMFALAYNEGQQQFQEQLNLDSKPMVDIDPLAEPNLVGSTEIPPPPQPEPDVPPEIPTEEDWIMIIFPSIRRYLVREFFLKQKFYAGLTHGRKLITSSRGKSKSGCVELTRLVISPATKECV
jgi:hypothetical protein